jgi:hypothetical protein
VYLSCKLVIRPMTRCGATIFIYLENSSFSTKPVLGIPGHFHNKLRKLSLASWFWQGEKGCLSKIKAHWLRPW